MKYPWAVVGAKVVCIKPKPEMAPADAIYPEVGKVYTIRAVKPVGYGGLNAPCLMLSEIDNTHMRPEPYEPGFSCAGFRPLVSKDDDIAMFQRIADKALAQNGIHVSVPHEEHA